MTGPLADESPRGRLFVVTGSTGSTRLDVAGALASRLGACVLVDGDAVEGMVVGWRAREPDGSAVPGIDGLRRRLLRWSACLALAETYQLDGVDAVVTDVLLDDAIEAFLDLAAPEPVHLVVVDDGATRATPRWGLWLVQESAAEIGAVADTILERLDQALVLTS